MKTLVPVRCIHCGTPDMIPVDAYAFRQWKEGRMNVQLIPGLTPDQREMLISSTCPDCFPIPCERCQEPATGESETRFGRETLCEACRVALVENGLAAIVNKPPF